MIVDCVSIGREDNSLNITNINLSIFSVRVRLPAMRGGELDEVTCCPMNREYSLKEKPDRKQK